MKKTPLKIILSVILLFIFSLILCLKFYVFEIPKIKDIEITTSDPNVILLRSSTPKDFLSDKNRLKLVNTYKSEFQLYTNYQIDGDSIYQTDGYFENNFVDKLNLVTGVRNKIIPFLPRTQFNVIAVSDDYVVTLDGHLLSVYEKDGWKKISKILLKEYTSAAAIDGNRLYLIHLTNNYDDIAVSSLSIKGLKLIKKKVIGLFRSNSRNQVEFFNDTILIRTEDEIEELDYEGNSKRKIRCGGKCFKEFRIINDRYIFLDDGAIFDVKEFQLLSVNLTGCTNIVFIKNNAIYCFKGSINNGENGHESGYDVDIFDLKSGAKITSLERFIAYDAKFFRAKDYLIITYYPQDLESKYKQKKTVVVYR